MNGRLLQERRLAVSGRNIGKRAIAKRRVNAPQRVYENLDGEVFSGPGVGSLWKMPIRFLEKSGTPIYVSLTGDGGRKTVFQRSNRAEWIKRLLATLAWKEARIDLGYVDAVVWIGEKRFQPTSDDLAGVGCSCDELDAVAASVRTSVPRPTKGRKDRHKGEDPMAKNAKKVKKVKKGKKVSKGNGAMTPEERAKSGPSPYCCSLLGTTTKTNEQVSAKIQKRFPECSDAYVSGTGVSSRRRALATGAESYLWAREIPGFKMKNVLSHYDDTPRSKPKKAGNAKKAAKGVKKVVKKGVVKKVHKRPITKKSTRKVIKKVRR